MPSSITPKYAKRLVRGKEYARVTLTCSKTARRRDVLLGLYGSPESRQAYHRAIADWEAAGRVLPAARVRTHAARELSVAQLCHTYRSHAVKTYSQAHALFIGLCINALVRLYGETAAASIGPNAIRAVRDDLANAKAPRRRWSRQTINRAVRLIAQMFRWAVGREFVPASQAEAIRAVEPLRRDRYTAPESEPVGCAPGKSIRAVRRFLSPQVAAMIDLQLLTGMRPGEVCQLRSGDIDRSGAVWIARPAHHKNAHGVTFLGAPWAKELVETL